MDADSILHDLGFTNIGGEPVHVESNCDGIDHEFKLKHGEAPEVILKQKQDDDGR